MNRYNRITYPHSGIKMIHVSPPCLRVHENKEKHLPPNMGVGASHQTKLEREFGGIADGDGQERFFGLENFGNTCYCNSVLQARNVSFRQGGLHNVCAVRLSVCNLTMAITIDEGPCHFRDMFSKGERTTSVFLLRENTFLGQPANTKKNIPHTILYL